MKCFAHFKGKSNIHSAFSFGLVWYLSLRLPCASPSVLSSFSLTLSVWRKQLSAAQQDNGDISETEPELKDVATLLRVELKSVVESCSVLFCNVCVARSDCSCLEQSRGSYSWCGTKVRVDGRPAVFSWENKWVFPFSCFESLRLKSNMKPQSHSFTWPAGKNTSD